jgi:hypothetical protein
MGKSFLPSREADLVNWSFNFKELIVANPTLYGLTVPLATAYAALHDDFAEAYTAAIDPGTRTPAAIILKNTAMDALKANARQLAKLVQGTPTVTDEQRGLLGLTVPAERTPINPPTETPVLEVIGRLGTIVSIKLHDGSGSRRGKPAGVAGATVFSYVGATPPVDVGAWTFQGNTTRNTVDVEFPVGTAAGTTVWLCAFWYNPRGQSGPGCAPVSAIIAGGAMAQAA